ncbi:hypothetical protein [Actinoallomurus rhizosphaericola]|uniref:hypothetical protein n=1 Tax=Actinoallomurus rhizosphaericola TaxID=2952536 RepID=UPI00209285F5|nr:hypothetical protein [Actinoallomurus rhizosphaericola]MCO5999421.1 hypothetical protein [Actinoallomurus rhizosphaericola]
MTVRLVRNELHVGSRPLDGPAARGPAVRIGETVISVVSASLPLSCPYEPGRVTDEHLRAEADEEDPAWLAVADVIVRSGPGARTGPSGALLAVVEGPRERVAVPGGGWMIDVPSWHPPGAFASFVHTWLVTGRSLRSLTRASLLPAQAGPDCRIRARRVLTSSASGAP